MTNKGYDDFFKKARQSKASKKGSKKTSSGTSRGAAKLEKMVQRNREKQRGKTFPIGIILGVLLAVGIGSLSLLNMDELEKWLDVVDVSVFTSAIAETGGEKKSPAKSEKGEKAASEKSPASVGAAAGRKTFNQEQLSVFANLEERSKELDRREAELAKLEEELQRQQGELEKRIQQLEVLRVQIASQLEEKVQLDKGKVTTLVDVYTNMKPQNAAKVFENMNEDLAVELLTRMKKKSSADILNLLSAGKAQRLSEKFAGYKRK